MRQFPFSLFAEHAGPRWPSLRIAPLTVVVGIAVVGSGLVPPDALTTKSAPVVESSRVELVALLRLFGDGTADSPNGGLLIGNGYSYGTVAGDCPGTT